MYQKIFDLIEQYGTIIIHRHQRPDGDCIGTQLGLRELLRATYPNKQIYAVGKHAIETLNFLGKVDEVSDDIYPKALVIVVDTSTPERVFDERYQNGHFIIKIDHHDDSPFFGNIEYVDPEIPACGAIIVDFFQHFQDKLVMNKAAADALLTAIISDTGRFHYRGVNSAIFLAAAILLDHGADIQYIYNNLYLQNKNELDLAAQVYDNICLTPNGVAYINITIALREKFNVPDEQAAELVSSLSTIKGSLIWVAFIEMPDASIRVRLRSRYVVVNDIASEFHGGGHLNASGATVYNKEEQNELLDKLDQKLYIYKKEHPECL